MVPTIFPFPTVADPLDDIQNEMHKNFMRRYIEVWPHPPCIDVNVGETLNAELDGVQQQCKVLYIDQNLIKVLFTVSTIKRWSLDHYTAYMFVLYL